jgi:SAM-dependent methyltransferase
MPGIRGADKSKQALDGQNRKWTEMFSDNPNMLGSGCSEPGQYALEKFTENDCSTVLELGGGQGRDTLPFAENGLNVHTLDYTTTGLEAIGAAADAAGLAHRITLGQHDVRLPLPFADESFDACYSHMLYCMAFTVEELVKLSSEVHRVLKPGGLSIYTVRNTDDAHYGTGIHRGEGLYEVGEVIVHFFSRQTVEDLSDGFQVVDVTEFEEGGLPRRLFRVTLSKG